MTEAKSFSTLLANAQAAYRGGQNAEAVKLFSEAVTVAPASMKASIQIAKARAQFRAAQYMQALNECSSVLGSSDNGAEVDQAFSAYQLRGECYLREGELESARDAFTKAKSSAKKDTQIEAVDKFLAATNEAISGNTEVDFEALKQYSNAATAKDRKFVPAPPATEQASKANNDVLDAIGGKGDDNSDDDEPPKPPPSNKPYDAKTQAARVQEAMSRPGPSVRAEDLTAGQAPFNLEGPLLAPQKYRMQFNQNAGNVEVQVFAKKLNTQRERVSVTISNDRLDVVIKDEELKDAVYELHEELYQPIDADASKWDIWATQVNIKLKKADGSISWPTLGKSDLPAVSGGQSVVNATAPPARAYPSSSAKAKAHDWDKLEADLKQQEKEEKPEGEAGLQKLFQQIYGNADEDTRRAMNKSFQESGGTTLSTNWKEVGGSQLECKPPEGVKVKKFEY